MIDLWEVVAGLEPGTLLWILAVAVIISPWVVRARNRARRLLRSLSLIALGSALTLLLQALPPS